MQLRNERRSRWPWLTLIGIAVIACEPDREPEIVVGVDGCAACGMLIEDRRQACAWAADRELPTFCSPGCLLGAFEIRRKSGDALPDRLYFADYEGGGLYPPESVAFLLTEHVPTVMGWGILSFADPEAARRHQEHEDEVIVDWLGLRRLRGEPDRQLVSSLTPAGLEPSVMVLTKDELVTWVVHGRGLTVDQSITLRGYEELGEIVISASREPIEIRLLASRPGSGFPVIRSSDGEIVGQLRVLGAHTPDEEQR